MWSKDIDKMQSIKIGQNINGVEIYDRQFCNFIQSAKQKNLTSLFKTIVAFKKVNKYKEVTYVYVDDLETRIECSYDETIVRHLILLDTIQYGFLSMVDYKYHWFGDYEDMQYEQKEMYEELERQEDENTKRQSNNSKSN
tara:strand:+ start:63 stop:482 length:420 start_codon:yes stop_codon:yes gene_type:complete